MSVWHRPLVWVTREIREALKGANAPSSENPFATMDDVGGGGSIPDPLELGAAVFADSIAVGVEDTDGFLTVEPGSINVYLESDEHSHSFASISGSVLTMLDSSLGVDVSSGDLTVGPWKVLIESSNYVIRPGSDNRAAQFGSAAFPIYYIFTALPTSDPGSGGMWVNAANHNAVTVGSGA